MTFQKPGERAQSCYFVKSSLFSHPLVFDKTFVRTLPLADLQEQPLFGRFQVYPFCLQQDLAVGHMQSTVHHVFAPILMHLSAISYPLLQSLNAA